MDGPTRREVLKVAGVAGAAALLADDAAAAAPAPAPAIVSHRSTDGVIVPPRGASFMKLSFDTPEPSIRFAGLELGFTIFSRGLAVGPRVGFSPFDPRTLSMPRREGLLPTMTVVDDTFTAHQTEMTAVIREARSRAGLR
jgi:hypothetical protein